MSFINIMPLKLRFNLFYIKICLTFILLIHICTRIYLWDFSLIPIRTVFLTTHISLQRNSTGESVHFLRRKMTDERDFRLVIYYILFIQVHFIDRSFQHFKPNTYRSYHIFEVYEKEWLKWALNSNWLLQYMCIKIGNAGISNFSSSSNWPIHRIWISNETSKRDAK